MRSIKGLVTAAAVFLFLLVAGCGSALDALPGSGGGSKSQSSNLTPPVSSGSLFGVAKDSLIRNATVRIFAWNGAKGELLGSATTDDRGRYSLELQARSQPILLEVSDGVYTEEVTLKNVVLKPAQALYAVQNYLSGQSLNTVITYYTTLATGLAEHLVRLGMNPPDAVVEANTRLSRVIGIDTRNVVPTDILAPDNFSAPELQYGFATAALSSLTERSSILNDDEPHDVFTSVLFIQSAYDDVRADGVLNGRGLNGEVTFGRIRLTSRLYRHELALHILRIANNKIANRTGLGATQMFELARRLNDSTDPIFGGDPVIPIDGEKPNVSAIVAQQFPNLPNGAVVFGGLDLSAMVATFPGAASAQLLLDGQVIGTVEDPENPSWRLETLNPQIADGRHTLAFRVTDISGAVGESPPLDVNVSNQQTAIANISIAGQFVGTQEIVVTANIVDPARPRRVEYSVRARGATEFVPVATMMPNAGETMLQSSATIAFRQPQFADGDAVFRVAVTNSVGVVFSREVPFVLDLQNPIIEGLNTGSPRFFDRSSGRRCTPRQPIDLTDSCIPYIGAGFAVLARVRDNRAIDTQRLTLTIDGGAAAVPGINDDDNGTPMSISFIFNPVNTTLNLGPDGLKTVTLVAQDVAQNVTVVSQSVFIDTVPPRILNFQIVPADASSTVRQVNGITMVSGRINISAVIEDPNGVNATQLLATGVNTFNEDSTGMTRVAVALPGYDTSNVSTNTGITTADSISIVASDLAGNSSFVSARVAREPR